MFISIGACGKLNKIRACKQLLVENNFLCGT